MRIGELSKRTGVSVRMLRYYEEEGLLQPARLGSGFRDFGEEEEQVVRRIRLLSEAGLKLETIKEMLPCVLSDSPDFRPCAAVLATLRREIVEIARRVECLQSSRKILESYLGGSPRHTSDPVTTSTAE